MPTADHHNLPICPLCNEAVEIETGKIDENRQAIHEECAVLQAARRYRDLATGAKE
jgi:hypothetical protein